MREDKLPNWWVVWGYKFFEKGWPTILKATLLPTVYRGPAAKIEAALFSTVTGPRVLECVFAGALKVGK